MDVSSVAQRPELVECPRHEGAECPGATDQGTGCASVAPDAANPPVARVRVARPLSGFAAAGAGISRSTAWTATQSLAAAV